MEEIIEIRYAGTVIAKTVAVRDQDGSGFFVGTSDPMPVGSVLLLKLDNQTKYGRVDQVVESTEPTLAGMRLHFVDGLPVRSPAPPPAARPAPVAAAVSAPAFAAPASAAPALASPAPAAPAPAPAVVAVADDDGPGGDGDGAGSPEAIASDPSQAVGGGRRRRRRR